MLIYKILACMILVCFAAGAYLYVIFQMPAHGSDESTTEDRIGAVNSFLIKTIDDG